jgi:hypothetical protein
MIVLGLVVLGMAVLGLAILRYFYIWSFLDWFLLGVVIPDLKFSYWSSRLNPLEILPGG